MRLGRALPFFTLLFSGHAWATDYHQFSGLALDPDNRHWVGVRNISACTLDVEITGLPTITLEARGTTHLETRRLTPTGVARVRLSDTNFAACRADLVDKIRGLAGDALTDKVLADPFWASELVARDAPPAAKRADEIRAADRGIDAALKRMGGYLDNGKVAAAVARVHVLELMYATLLAEVSHGRWNALADAAHPAPIVSGTSAFYRSATSGGDVMPAGTFSAGLPYTPAMSDPSFGVPLGVALRLTLTMTPEWRFGNAVYGRAMWEGGLRTSGVSLGADESYVVNGDTAISGADHTYRNTGFWVGAGVDHFIRPGFLVGVSGGFTTSDFYVHHNDPDGDDSRVGTGTDTGWTPYAAGRVGYSLLKLQPYDSFLTLPLVLEARTYRWGGSGSPLSRDGVAVPTLNEGDPVVDVTLSIGLYMGGESKEKRYIGEGVGASTAKVKKGALARSAATPPPRVVVRDDRFELNELIYFDTDKDTIQSRSFTLLDDVVAAMVAHPEVQLLRVEGHTDSRGDDAYNLDLSQRRAQAVVAYLVAKGVAADRLVAKGFGESRPVDAAENEDAWARNRRVEMLIERRASTP